MRITGGEYRGRVLQAPKGNAVRPTSDRTRQAVFNILTAGRWRSVDDGFDLDDAQVMDIFCGTGALGLEAISRGARACAFVDKDRTSLSIATANAQMLKLDNVSFLLRDAAKMGARPVHQDPADLVFIDPPYRKGLVFPALSALVDGGWLNPHAVLVIETENDPAEDDIAGLPFDVLDGRSYGDTFIRILRYNP